MARAGAMRYLDKMRILYSWKHANCRLDSIFTAPFSLILASTFLRYLDAWVILLVYEP